MRLPVFTEHQRFELFSLDLWRRRLQDPDAQRFGRNGQRQYGIDILGRDRRAASAITGIQCKLPSRGHVTVKQFDEEVARATEFRPKLDAFWLMFAGPRDAKLQMRAAQLHESHKKSGLFGVHVYAWEDLEEEITSWPTLVDMYWPELAPSHDLRFSRLTNGSLRVEFTLTADADWCVASIFDELEVRSLFDGQFLAEVRDLVAELAINAHDHGRSRRYRITFGTSSIDLRADGPAFNPLEAPITGGAGMRVLRHFREVYRDRVRVAWNCPSLRIHALSDRAFRHDACLTTYHYALMSRARARSAALQVSFPPSCMFYTVVMSRVTARSVDRIFVEAVLEQAPPDKVVIFEGEAHPVRADIVEGFAPRAKFSPR